MINVKVLFEVRTVKEAWQPPFKKQIETEQIVAGENEKFAELDQSGIQVFQLVKAGQDRVLIEFSNLVTPKRVDERPISRQIWLGFGEEKSFTAQWASNGVSKVIKPLKFVAEEASAPESVTIENSTPALAASGNPIKSVEELHAVEAQSQ